MRIKLNDVTAALLGAVFLSVAAAPVAAQGGAAKVVFPTDRTALLTGHNHHANNAGAIMELATAFPGNIGAS